jgi:hypothetical protein
MLDGRQETLFNEGVRSDNDAGICCSRPYRSSARRRRRAPEAGVVATLQPANLDFGRVYAAYGGYFIALSVKMSGMLTRDYMRLPTNLQFMHVYHRIYATYALMQKLRGRQLRTR